VGEPLPAPLPSQCDLLVIGGGVNGLGVALDAAGRGLSVALIEKEDWGCGATAASSRLIHGGLRYLRYGEVSLVRESLAERGLLLRQRPHLVRPIEMHIPCFRGRGVPPLALQIGLRLYHELAKDPDFPAPSKLARGRMSELEPGLAADGLQCAFVYADAQMDWPERLCAELAVEAAGLGAALRNHCTAFELLRDRSQVTGAR